jgi:hypothetical protein
MSFGVYNKACRQIIIHPQALCRTMGVREDQEPADQTWTLYDEADVDDRTVPLLRATEG